MNAPLRMRTPRMRNFTARRCCDGTQSGTRLLKGLEGRGGKWIRLLCFYNRRDSVILMRGSSWLLLNTPLWMWTLEYFNTQWYCTDAQNGAAFLDWEDEELKRACCLFWFFHNIVCKKNSLALHFLFFHNYIPLFSKKGLAVIEAWVTIVPGTACSSWSQMAAAIPWRW